MLLEVSDLVSGYDTSPDVLHRISISVARSSFTGLIGPNGAGKTTLLNTLYGFLKPRGGRIALDGVEITRLAPHLIAQKGLGYIPQESSLFPFLSVEDNLKIATSRLRGKGAIENLEEVLGRFPNLKAKRKQQAGDLSGGEQKMLEIAKALLLKPRLLLVDEPTVGLAPKLAASVYERLRELREEGVTILLVDQNIKQTVELSDYIYVMNLGHITGEGPKARFQTSLRDIVKEWFSL